MITLDVVEQAYERAKRDPYAYGFDQLDQLLRSGGPLPKAWREGGAQVFGYAMYLPVEIWRREQELEAEGSRERFMRHKVVEAMVSKEYGQITPFEREVKYYRTNYLPYGSANLTDLEVPAGWQEVSDPEYADETQISLRALARPL